ncbi:alpha/beta hydrolase [Kocuria himachalensis]
MVTIYAYRGGMPTLELPRCRLTYDVTGAGPPVVQLHGLLSDQAANTAGGLDLASALTGHRTVRYDARGHGRSAAEPVAEDWTWPRLAEDLLHLLDAVAPGEPVHGIGPSMGAATLLHAALAEPRRFRSLTLCVPSTAWGSRRDQAGTYRRSADLVERHGLEAYLRAGRAAVRPPAVADRPAHPPRVDPGLLPAVLRGAASTDLPPVDELSRIGVPVLVLAWSGDATHPLSTAEALRAALPGDGLHVAGTPAELAEWPRRCAAFVRAVEVGRQAGPAV